MLAHPHARTMGESGDAIRFEVPFTAPFSQQQLRQFSSDDFSVEEPLTALLPLVVDDFSVEAPFTVPFPTMGLASPRHAVQVEQPSTEPHWPIDAPSSPDPSPELLPASSTAASRDLLPISTSPSVETALQLNPWQPTSSHPEPFHTQAISATTQKALRQQALQWREAEHCAIQSRQSKQHHLEDGFKHDAAALRERYVLEGVLAVGGTGIVYKARARPSVTNHAGAVVAIKTLRPELRTDTDAIQRLEREFLYTTALRHPNIVPHFGFEQASGTWFITMALLGGRSLASLLNDSKAKHPSVREALIILKGCSAALSFAHSHGIVHCDLKPGNVWITETGQVLVIDFGAAQPCASRSALENTRVRERPLPQLATPAYASPQVLAGKHAEPCDDIYSLACIAYELLGTRLPFGQADVVAAMTTGAIQGGMHAQHSQQATSEETVLRDIESSLEQVIAAKQISTITITPTVTPKEIPQPVIQQPVLPQQWQANTALSCTPATCETDLASYSTLNPWLIAARSHSQAQGAVPSRQHTPLQPRTLYGLNTAAICIVLALAVLVLFYGLPDSSTPSGSRATEIRHQTSPSTVQQMPVMLAPANASNDGSSSSTNRPAWQSFSVNGQSNPQWRLGVDLLPGTVNPYSSLTAAKVAAAPSASIALEQRDVSVSDRAVIAALLLTRSGSRRDPATVRWRTIAGSAKPGADYQDEPSGIARFADNQTTRVLYVPLKQNDIAIGDRSFSVELSRPSANAALGKISRAVVTIHSSK